MRLALYRQIETAISTQGELFVDGNHQCFTLERPGPQSNSDYHHIPAGTYAIILYDSPHFGRSMPLLRGLEEPIEIHWGNVPGASRGCILVGRVKGEDAVWFSREAFDDLFPFIQRAVEGGDGCQIEIHDVPGTPQILTSPDLSTQI